MKREYVAVPTAVVAPARSEAERCWSWNDTALLPALTVFEPEAAPKATGLLDHRGHRLYAVERPRRRIGFLPIKDD